MMQDCSFMQTVPYGYTKMGAKIAQLVLIAAQRKEHLCAA